MTSPSDREWSLAVSAPLLGAMLAVLALGCAIGAGTRNRAVAVTALVVGGSLLLASRLMPMPQNLLPVFGFGVTLVLAVVFLGLGREDQVTRVAMACAALVVAAIAFVIGLSADFSLHSGQVFTALAGNLAIDSADEDLSFALEAVFTGLVVGTVVSVRVWDAAPMPDDTREPQATTA
ncbi:MAG TPA: hypothetical protein VE172_01345 [Stackebrandtia sp.]|nr:hypothetical protein [Stackebrandtia sp.]